MYGVFCYSSVINAGVWDLLVIPMLCWKSMVYFPATRSSIIFPAIDTFHSLLHIFSKCDSEVASMVTVPTVFQCYFSVLVGKCIKVWTHKNLPAVHVLFSCGRVPAPGGGESRYVTWEFIVLRPFISGSLWFFLMCQVYERLTACTKQNY